MGGRSSLILSLESVLGKVQGSRVTGWSAGCACDWLGVGTGVKEIGAFYSKAGEVALGSLGNKWG